MRDWNALSDAEFRRATADFIEGFCPKDIRHRDERPAFADLMAWYRIMSEQGWLAPAWPREHGGMDLAPSKRIIHLEEMTRRGVPRVMEQGVMNVGPALLINGTSEQQRQYLPRILSGEHLWCQGYSEPGAGSDLAAVRTEAVIEGDEFVINGHKIWTSGALDANMMYVLARTDKSVAKQKGLSFILVDMAQPGLTVKPIVTIAGDAEFGEVFLDNVRAPLVNLVGPLNGGWGVTKSLLSFERIWAGSPHFGSAAMASLLKLVAHLGRTEDPVLLDRIAELKLDLDDITAMYEMATKQVGGGAPIGLEAQVLKIMASETYARVSELGLELAGEYGALDGALFGEVKLLKTFLNSRAPTIYGGTAQIQRNILAKAALGLPS
jgi:alkylation response protein AidB-like acyl-CoA dehydrogenase